MNLKGLLSVLAVALVSVEAADRTESATYCYNKKGMFLENRTDPTDTRFACLLPQTSSTNCNAYYCVNYGGRDLYYNPKYGNMEVCNKKSSQNHARGCALGMGYLYDSVYYDDQNYQKSNENCYKKNGSMFLYGQVNNPPIDHRYACLLPRTKNTNCNKYYCVNYGGKDLYYEPSMGNISYCDLSSTFSHGRGCALGLGYLYDSLVQEDNKHTSSKKTCLQKKGFFLDNPNERWDRRFACMLPGSSNNKYCVTFRGKSGCYAKEYSNMNVCDTASPEYNGRGCALGLGYLETSGKMSY